VRLHVANGNTGTVDIPISGPSPKCSDAPRSILRPGVNTDPGQAALPAPPSWGALSVHLSIGRFPQGGPLADVRVTFDNPTSQPIVLAPAPYYDIGIQDRRGDGTPGEAIKLLYSSSTAPVVPAHGTKTIRLADVDITPDYSNLVGNKLFVLFSMYAMGSAHLTLPLRR
jgi:hypothetical protein